MSDTPTKLSAEELTDYKDRVNRCEIDGWSVAEIRSLLDHIAALEAERNEALRIQTARLVHYCVCQGSESPVDGCDCVSCTTRRLEAELARIKGRLDEDALIAVYNQAYVDMMGSDTQIVQAIIAHITEPKP